MWAPYDEPTYTAVLAHIAADDVVLDIGAGDLRLTRAIAQRARSVIAIEQNAALLAEATRDLPANCMVVQGDAREVLFPQGITAAVLLMRHCAHFGLYVHKLLACGCRRLITNARWGLAPEVIDLRADRRPYTSLVLGWYACLCGGVGFVPGPAAALTVALADQIREVDGCPACTTVPRQKEPAVYRHTPTSSLSSHN
jgi:SAM-dependent methyltransferase